jgi:hypothetical protein
LGALDNLVKDENVLYVSFQRQRRGGTRIPASNKWDRGRTAVEATIHPNYEEEINYAALSLNEAGVLAWGAYQVLLKDKLIESRTTFLEENPFLLCERHTVVAGQAPPHGYRSTWNSRHKLAMAKLHDRLNDRTTRTDYPAILLRQGSSTGDADFIEAHIYGEMHRSIIEKVKGPRPKSGADRVLWRSIERALKALGVALEEL